MLAALIGEKDRWSKGLGQDAMHLLLDDELSIPNLNSIELIVHESYTRAVRCYEKLGFKITGRKREALINGSQEEDILASESESSGIL